MKKRWGTILITIYLCKYTSKPMYKYTYIVKWNCHIWADDAPYKSQSHLTKLDMRSPLLSCWSGLGNKLPNLTNCGCCLDCPWEVEGKSLFLNLPYISNTKPTAPWVWIDLNAFPPGLAFMVSEVAIQNYKGEKLTNNYDTCESQLPPELYDNSKRVK